MKNMKWLQTEVQENKNNRDSFQNAVWQFVIVCWFVCSFVWKGRDRGKERILSRHHALHRAGHQARSQDLDPEIMT